MAAAAVLLLLPAAAALVIRADDHTFENFADVTETETAPTPTGTSPLIASESAAPHPKDGYRTLKIVIWAIALAVLLASIGMLLWKLYRRRRARKDPYADTPLPTLDSSGRWGFTSDSRSAKAKHNKDGRGKWSRLEDESEPLTADLSSPEGSPTMPKRRLYEDEDRK